MYTVVFPSFVKNNDAYTGMDPNSAPLCDTRQEADDLRERVMKAYIRGYLLDGSVGSLRDSVKQIPRGLRKKWGKPPKCPAPGPNDKARGYCPCHKKWKTSKHSQLDIEWVDGILGIMCDAPLVFSACVDANVEEDDYCDMPVLKLCRPDVGRAVGHNLEVQTQTKKRKVLRHSTCPKVVCFV